MTRILIILALFGYAACQLDLPAPQKNGSVLLQPPRHVPIPRLARGAAVVPFPNGSEPAHGTHGQIPAPPVPLVRLARSVPHPLPVHGEPAPEPIPITAQPPTTAATS